MSLESVNSYLETVSQQARSKNLTFEQLLEESFNTCYGTPQVSEAAFLELCRRVDPNFAPIASEEERRARAALTEKVRNAFREIMSRNFNKVSSELRNEYRLQHSVQIPRHYFCFLNECESVEEQREVLRVLDGNDQRAKANLLEKHLLSKKDEILGMLDLDGEALVESYARNFNLLLLATELQKCSEYDYTQEQKALFDELDDHMAILLTLIDRMDLMASGYYANYPCERMDLRYEHINELFGAGASLSKRAGESTGGETSASGETRPIGPTFDFVSSFTALASVNAGVLEKRLRDFVKDNGAKDAKSCIWTSESGKAGNYGDTMTGLYEQQLIFVNIPDVGLKALYNGGQGFMNCVPREATAQEIYDRMCRVSENGVKRVDEANPFFLAKFTGSAQFNRMAAQHKAVKEMMPLLKPPLDNLGENLYQNAKDALKDLREFTDTYLAYKKGQGLKEDERTGLLIGRSANEKRRLAAAEEAIKLADALGLMLQYQKEPQQAAKFVQQREEERQAQIRAKQVTFEKEPPKPKIPFEPEELGKTPAEELNPIISRYQAIHTCEHSDAGQGLYKLQLEIPDSVTAVIRYTGLKTQIDEFRMNICKKNVAKIVLFDYMLRERQAHSEKIDGNIVAGPVERAYNNKSISAENLIQTPEFKEIFGKFTPARFETFLLNDESRRGVFDKAVQRLLVPVKANGMANQPAQPQAKVEMNQPQAQPQPEPPKPVAPNMGIPG